MEHIPSYDDLLHKIQKLEEENRYLKIENSLKQKADVKIMQLTRLFENSPVGIAITSVDFEILFVNNEITSIFGYSKNELLGTKTYPTIDQNNNIKKKIETQIEKLIKSGNSESEIEVVTKTGEKKTLIIRVSLPNPGLNDEGIIATFADITNQHKIEKQLNDQNELLNGIIESSPVYVFIRNQDGKYIFVNSELAAVYGKLKTDTFALSSDTFFSQELIDQYRVEDLEILEKGISTSKETSLVIENENRFFIVNKFPIRNKNGEPYLVGGIITDITSGKNTENELKRSENLYKLITENSKDVISILTPDLKFSYVSPSAEHIFGYKPHELINTPLKNIIPSEACIRAVRSREDRKLKTEDNDYKNTFELEFSKKDGSILWVEVITSPIRDKSRNIVGFIAQIRDISDRKKYQNALEEREATLRSIFRTAPVGIGVTINRVLIFVNDFFCNMLNYRAEELTNQNIVMLYPDKEEYDRVGSIKFPMMEKEGTVDIETRFKTSDGNILDIYLCSTPVDRTDFSKGIVFYALNITERKKTLQELRNKEEQFRRITEMNPIPIVITDHHEKIISFNQKFTDLYGYTTGDIKTAEQWFTTVYPNKEYRELVKNEWYKAINQAIKVGSSIIPQTWEIRCKDGTKKIVEFSFVPLKDIFVIAIKDITEQKLNEIKLAESEVKYRNMFVNMYSGVAVYEAINNAEDFIFVDFNKAAEKITKISRNSVIGKSLLTMFPKIVDTPLIKALRQVHKTGTAVLLKPFFLKENLFEGWRENKIYKLPSGLVVSIFDDVTEQIKAKNELILAKEKAEESERLKSAFLSNMSHEIRTPMNGILGFSQMLLKEGITEEKRKQYAKIIIESGNQLLGIIDDILDVSKLETGLMKLNQEVVNINLLISDIFTFYHPKAHSSQISLYTEKELYDYDCFIITDALKLRQILNNLLSNALKFTNKGYIRFGYTVKGNFLEFFVKDTGIGIDPSMYDQIFERFRQAEENLTRKYGGTGLGLSICRSLARLMGGDIRVESEKNKGSVFYFTIPFITKLEYSEQ